MSSLTVSRPSVDPVVAVAAFNWFFPEPMIQVEPNPEFCVYNFSSSEVEPQLEMFPRQAEFSDYFWFKYLAAAWRAERGATSSTTEMVLSPAYQSIIGMGSRAVGFILRELASEGDNPDHWFWALQMLTRANPVSDEDEGNLRNMSRAWLTWASSQGYAW